MPSDFATTITADPQGLGRCSMIPYSSIRFTHLWMAFWTRDGKGLDRRGVSRVQVEIPLRRLYIFRARGMTKKIPGTLWYFVHESNTCSHSPSENVVLSNAMLIVSASRSSWRVNSVVLLLVWAALVVVLGTADIGTMLPNTVFRVKYTC